MIIPVFSSMSNSGKKTLSLTLGNMLAKTGHSVLLVELDYTNPSLAKTYGLHDSERNTESFIKQSAMYGSFNLQNNIINVHQLNHLNERLGENAKNYSSNLDLMVFSENYLITQLENTPLQHWDANAAFEYYSRLHSEFISSNYDYIILILPTGIDDVFSLPPILASDVCINIFNFNTIQLNDTKNILSAFNVETQKKFINVINNVPKKLNKLSMSNYCNPIPIHQILPFDEQRAIFEMRGSVGSSYFDEIAKSIIESLLRNTKQVITG